MDTFIKVMFKTKMSEQIVNQNIFKQILDQTDNIVVDYIQIEDKKYKSNPSWSLTVFALNVILVLEGARLAYKDISLIDNNPFLINFIEKLCDEIIVISDSKEPFVLLKKNKNQIKNLLLEEEDNGLGIAKILGYAYVGNDWYGSENKYHISYWAIDNNNKEFPLYTFVCPIEKFNNEIRNKLLNDKCLFESILNKYGFDVKIKILVKKEGCKIQEGCEDFVMNISI